jgi:predicted MFS family arabinose efflux permease
MATILGSNLRRCPVRERGAEQNLIRLPWTTSCRVFVPFAGGYFLSYLFRTVNAIIAPNLVHDIGLTASDLGLLTSAYFLAFALCQIPLGVVLDRYGPRRVDAALLVVASIGALLFASGNRTTNLLIGRALIGAGVSACLMASFQAFTLWFVKERLSFVNGCIMACGGLGALMATSPVEALLQLVSWRLIFTALGVVTLVVALLIYAIVPEHVEAKPDHRLARQLADIVMIYRSRLFWQLAPLTMLSQGALMSLQGLWAGPWLQDVGKLARHDVASYLLLIAAAMLSGYLIIGFIGAKLQYHGIPLTTVLGFSTAVFLAAQMLICLGIVTGALYWWMIFCFTGSTSIVSFAILSQAFPSHLTGRINTALNLLIFLSAFAIQYGIGAVIDLWPPNAVGRYGIVSYRTAFGLLLGFEFLAFVWFLIPVPSHQRSTR